MLKAEKPDLTKDCYDREANKKQKGLGKIFANNMEECMNALPVEEFKSIRGKVHMRFPGASNRDGGIYD